MRTMTNETKQALTRRMHALFNDRVHYRSLAEQAIANGEDEWARSLLVISTNRGRRAERIARTLRAH